MLGAHPLRKNPLQRHFSLAPGIASTSSLCQAAGEHPRPQRYAKRKYRPVRAASGPRRGVAAAGSEPGTPAHGAGAQYGLLECGPQARPALIASARVCLDLHPHPLPCDSGLSSALGAGVVSGALVYAANTFSPRFRGALGISGKTALVVTPIFGAFTLSSHLRVADATRDASGYAEQASVAAANAKAEPLTSLPLWCRAANVVYEHPFKTIMGCVAHELSPPRAARSSGACLLDSVAPSRQGVLPVVCGALPHRVDQPGHRQDAALAAVDPHARVRSGARDHGDGGDHDVPEVDGRRGRVPHAPRAGGAAGARPQEPEAKKLVRRRHPPAAAADPTRWPSVESSRASSGAFA